MIVDYADITMLTFRAATASNISDTLVLNEDDYLLSKIIHS